MKKFNCLFGILLFTTFTFFASCSGEKENNQDKETTHLLRFSPQDGDNYDISFVMNMEGLMDMSMGMECFQKVLSVDGDEIDFKIGYDKATMSMSMMGEDINYDSDNPYENEVTSEMHKEISPLFSADLRMTMDSRGKILKESGYELLGGDFGSQMGLTNVEYPEHALNIGDSFDFSVLEEGMSMDATYTLIDVSDSEYILSITGELVGEASGKVTGKMILFRECGMPKTVNLQIEMDIEGQKMNMILSLMAIKS